LALARIIRRVYIQGQSYGEVMSDVPYMSGFLFRFAVFFGMQPYFDPTRKTTSQKNQNNFLKK
jgi:hypothetical protein